MNARLLAAVLSLFVLISGAPARSGRLHPALEEKLRALRPDAMVTVIVELEDQVVPEAALARSQGRDRRSRARALVESLKERATGSQDRLRGTLEREVARGAAHSVVPFWIFNGFAVTATEPVIRMLAARPDVREVRLDSQIPPPSPVPAAWSQSATITEWNIARIRAPETWTLGPDFDGTGAVVGSFDTGVDFTHPDLASRYRGNHNISWFDPYRQHAEPFDFHGHGTHTTGTAVGGDAGGTLIGVAPGARWIAAKGWNDFGIATASAFHRIFEWFLAPGGDPDNAPDVVINSWAFEQVGCDTEFVADIRAWRAAGIFPAFASGNDGPAPGSVRSPGAYPESFAVGATDYFDDSAYFSGQGPSPCDQSIKPNISAPGDGITSAIPGGYAELSGTSMATPHTAGAVAVLRSIRPDATVAELEASLADGAVDLGEPGADNAFGAGRLDLYVSAQIILLGSDVPKVRAVATAATATEAGLSPGVFTLSRTGSTDESLTVSYTVAGTAEAGSDYVALSGTADFAAGDETVTINVTPIDDAIVEYNETVTITLKHDTSYIVASPDSASVTIVSDEIRPDLSVAAFTVPAGAGAGENITVTDTVQNLGGGPAEASVIRFYLSANAALDSADLALGSRALPVLAPGASDTGSTVLTIPSGTSAGNCYIIAKADADNALIETSEGNNTFARSIQIGPDLVVSAFSAPTTGGAGITLTVTDTVKNQGGATAAASLIHFFLSANGTLDSADVLLGGRAVPVLAPGASSSGSTAATIPGGIPTGSHYLIAKADGENALSEYNEMNNTSARTILIGPDLVVSAFSAPPTAGPDATITVTDTAKNQGAGAAEASVTSFYFSANSILDASDTRLGNRPVPALAPGAVNTVSTVLTIPATAATGTHYIIARADGDGQVSETNENNNSYARSIQIGADLMVSSLSSPAVAGAGTAIAISDTVKNQGGAAAAASVIQFFLSANSTLDAADALLGGRSVPALAPAATNSGSTAVTIPAGTATGTYQIIARADAEDAVPETYENNNTRYRSIAVGPDLDVTALSSPASSGAGASITVTDTIKNIGGGAAAATITHFYFSANATLDSGDAPLGSRNVPTLAPGAANSASATLTIPTGTATGSYYIIAWADGDAAVAETNENNNIYASSIKIGPDLDVTAFSSPTSAPAGAAITVTDTVKNVGGGAAAASVTKFYLSSNGTLDPGDLLLGGRTVAALAPGASGSGSTVLTIPGGTAPGSYYIIAKADGDDTVAETSENNNTYSRSLGVGPG